MNWSDGVSVFESFPIDVPGATTPASSCALNPKAGTGTVTLIMAFSSQIQPRKALRELDDAQRHGLRLDSAGERRERALCGACTGPDLQGRERERGDRDDRV